MMLKRFKNIAIGRRIQSVSFFYYDIEIHDEGLGLYFMWRTNSIRLLGISNIRDLLKRMSRKDVTAAADTHELSFYAKWDDVLGIVTYDVHREVMIRTPSEVFKVLFRKNKVYDEFKADIASKCEGRIFSRDSKQIKESIFEGAGEMGIPVHIR